MTKEQGLTNASLFTWSGAMLKFGAQFGQKTWQPFHKRYKEDLEATLIPEEEQFANKLILLTIYVKMRYTTFRNPVLGNDKVPLFPKS